MHLSDCTDTKTFQKKYLVVYTLAFFADWLKGPYVYALYESYGLSSEQIAMLFIVGFGASGVSGPFVGSLADTFGRKMMSLSYFIIYIASALCKIWPNYDILLIGRILGGMGTSLLVTVLESWMVSEHHRQKYSQDDLDNTFSIATTLNSAAAILAGITAQAIVPHYGYVSPFLLALLPLIAGFILCFIWWESDSESIQVRRIPFSKGLQSMGTNLWILGIVQSLFLGSMYTFVFLWTPVLQNDPHLSHGVVFSTFMVMISIGSATAKCFSKYLEKLPFLIFFIAIAANTTTTLYINDYVTCFFAFIGFEFACGVMFPTFGSLRSIYIPNEHRASIMNIYRIPLNVFVILVLINKRFMSLQTVFAICAIANMIAAFTYYFFKPNIKIQDGNQYELGLKNDEEEDFGDIDDELESISDPEDVF